LAVVLVGEDPASLSYVTGKEKALAEAGMAGRDIRLPAATTEAEPLELVSRLNIDPEVDGILVQLPLPKHIREDRIFVAIDPARIGCFHPCRSQPGLGRPGTCLHAHGVIVMLRRWGCPPTAPTRSSSPLQPRTGPANL
jgi:methylenetetrahydrofolate dehydrogenase (NADP+)/methenyltetrahydrofolate cyclohydrolase